MFAVWTQSWLPTAMIINYITQLQAADALATVAAGNGITAANMFEFYDTAATRIGLASELFAMTPMLTYALLTGGIQAMTSLAGAMNQKDHFSEKDLAPDVMKTGELANIGAGSTRSHDNNSHIINENDPRAIYSERGQLGSGAFASNNISSATAANATVADSVATTDSKNYSDAVSKAYLKQMSTSNARKTNEAIATQFSNSHGETATVFKGLTTSIDDATKIGETKSKRVAAYLAGNISAGIKTPFGGAAMEAGLRTEAGLSAEEAKSVTAALKEDKGTKSSIDNAMKITNTRQGGLDISRTIASGLGKNEQESFTALASRAEASAHQASVATSYANNSTSGQTITNDLAGTLLSGKLKETTLSTIKERALSAGMTSELRILVKTAT